MIRHSFVALCGLFLLIASSTQAAQPWEAKDLNPVTIKSVPSHAPAARLITKRVTTFSVGNTAPRRWSGGAHFPNPTTGDARQTHLQIHSPRR